MEYDVYDEMKLWLVAFDHVVKETGVSQAEIARGTGLTSSYISNAIGPKRNRPVSEEARASVSEFLGKTLEEMVELGKSIAVRPASITPMHKPWSTDELQDMTAHELWKASDEYANVLMAYFSEHAKLFTERVKNLIQERNRLLHAYEDVYSLVESSPDAITITTPDKKRIYSNREHTRLFGEYIAESCNESCTFAECHVDEVVKSGKMVAQIVQHDDRWYGVRAWPKFDSKGQISQIIASYRDITEEHERALNNEV